MDKSKLYNDVPYLPFAAHGTQSDAALDMPKQDVTLLRELGKRYAEAASSPENARRKSAWADINDLRGGRPLVWANEICWHEMNVNNELTLVSESPIALRIESMLRRTLYQWNHLQGDMIIEQTFFSPYILENTGFGIAPDADIAITDPNNTIASRRFHCQIKRMEDIDQIKTPGITLQKERTEAFFQQYSYIFDGIIAVEKYGCSGFWFAPWDDIVLWMGAEEVLTGLAAEPELMHVLIKRLTDAYLGALDQLEALKLVASNNLNVRVGSGGYGYTRSIPPAADGCGAMRIWGSATPQIFSSVSPRMHDEFGLTYEKRWLERFALSYYGCCEPLHNKLDILKSIPNLRKISISPWADTIAASEQMRGKYVVSLKPTPAFLACDTFDSALAEDELREKLKQLKGCCVEVILKDISTVRGEPERLWRWMDMAMRVAQEFG